jgi:apolipoprotein N-acyltransferase
MPRLPQSFSPYYRRVLLNAGLSLLSALLLVAIFPRFDFRILAPITLTPLLVALARTPNGWQRFTYGWAAGILYWFLVCTWIQFVLEVYGGMGRWGGWASFFLFAILKGLHLAFFSWLTGPLMRRAYAIPAVATLWTGLERTHATFGFAWLDIGNAAIDMSVPLRLAPFVGVYGISFVFAMLAAGLACVMLRQPRTRLLPLLALPLLWLLPGIPERVPANNTALVVQPNINPDVQWTTLLQADVEQQLSLLSRIVPAPLVIWPELPAPLYYYDDPEFRQATSQIARYHGYFLFSTIGYTSAHQPMNSAVLLGPDGLELGRYDKVNLVPFGEFVPPLFSFVNRITQEAGDFVPGHDSKVLPAAGHRLGVFICYESAFPNFVRQFSRKGADVLVNLSNDAYFGRSDAREQHLLLVRMRAVENRRFIIRSTNNGITAVLDPSGRITSRLPSYQQIGALMHYGAVESTTFYARHGDWFAWSCLVIGVALAGWNLRPGDLSRLIY